MEISFNYGDKVEVLKGFFKGQIGTVESHRNAPAPGYFVSIPNYKTYLFFTEDIKLHVPAAVTPVDATPEHKDESFSLWRPNKAPIETEPVTISQD